MHIKWHVRVRVEKVLEKKAKTKLRIGLFKLLRETVGKPAPGSIIRVSSICKG